MKNKHLSVLSACETPNVTSVQQTHENVKLKTSIRFLKQTWEYSKIPFREICLSLPASQTESVRVQNARELRSNVLLQLPDSCSVLCCAGWPTLFSESSTGIVACCSYVPTVGSEKWTFHSTGATIDIETREQQVTQLTIVYYVT